VINFWKRIQHSKQTLSLGLFGVSLGMTGWVVALELLGVFQLPELLLLDQFFRWRSPEPQDSRIVVITMSESDLATFGQWPISDELLAELLTKIAAQEPVVIGLDMFRDLPVEPGHDQLADVFETQDNLFGIDKVAGETVASPPILERRNQVGFADIVTDPDGKCRRGLLSIQPVNREIRSSLPVQLALAYLAERDIELESSSEYDVLSLGEADLTPLSPNFGGYVNADTGGYQVLINFRGNRTAFETVSMQAVLNGEIPEDLMRDRIVLIGSTAESLRDFFQTPYGKMPGVFVHANLVSQLISSALDGRPSISSLPEPIEWLIVWFASAIGMVTVSRILHFNIFGSVIVPYVTITAVLIVASGIVITSFWTFLWGWWIPVVPALTSLTGGAIVGTCLYSQALRKLVAIDGLTKVANRRYFDDFLARKASESGYISLILCDIDFFKLYNDTYGHQGGDECLRQVAKALCMAVRKSDFVARYGGEEFAIVLPNTNLATAQDVAERIVIQVRAMRIPHMASNIGGYVTLSCGVASMASGPTCPWPELIARADKALYQAKHEGRDRFATWDVLNNACP
jgi:diguanylate cyclase (GGDEF)-like protein